MLLLIPIPLIIYYAWYTMIKDTMLRWNDPAVLPRDLYTSYLTRLLKFINNMFTLSINSRWYQSDIAK